MNNIGKRLILLELNEINFDLVERYIGSNPGRFPAFRKLLSGPRIRTSSEKHYDLLEPWIQWTSVHTCRTYSEHGIFRLGDMEGATVPQIFEELEQAGFSVGCISAMNAENRLKHPAYFIPDPWIRTPADNSWWSRSLAQAVSQAVNDNARARITYKSAIQIFLAMIRFARIVHYKNYLALASVIRSKPWLKSLVLDLLLHDVHWSLFKTNRPSFSTLFLNAGAHLQHHYFFNAQPLRNDTHNRNPEWYINNNEDPIADVLDLYDLIVGEYFARTDTEVILATGLAQRPYDRVKFYYRLNSHAKFLEGLGIQFTHVSPRMTRDFLIEFDSENEAKVAQELLGSLSVADDGVPLFGEIDNRGSSLFVTLTYPKEITKMTRYKVGDRTFPLFSEVSFVAIKNGMHQDEGFAFFTPEAGRFAPADGSHVAQLGRMIKRFFGLEHTNDVPREAALDQ